MKIITWNCNMAFRKKAHAILEYKPDILIIPECEHPDKLNLTSELMRPISTLWFGTNRNKGLGIFSYNNYQFKLLDTHNSQLKMIIPIAVSGGQEDFILYAIWANNPNDPDGQYIEQVWKAIKFYDLSTADIMLAGDFNSNTIWDRKHRESNHSNVVKYLEEKKIFSAYHLHFNQTQGKEKHPTLYMYRHQDKPYHIDYCFVSQGMAERLQSVEIGDYHDWVQYSDHVPVIISFNSQIKISKT